MKEKKQWQKPALIVLVRRKPEEAVLIGCKVEMEYTTVGGRPCMRPACPEVVPS